MELFLIESPGKLKKIKSFLPDHFEVRACCGHVRDLRKKCLSIDIPNDFTPEFIVLPQTKKLVKSLQALASTSTCVWLATDADLEGESIALKLPSSKIKRVTYFEVTHAAIRHAMDHPMGIDMNKVQAQMARRLLDRLVGYQTSHQEPALCWKSSVCCVQIGCPQKK